MSARLINGAAALFSGWAGGMVTPVRFLFLLLVLQIPLPIAGLIEGLALGAPLIARALLPAPLAATTPRWLLPAEYALLNAARPLIALAGSWLAVIGVVLVERIGAGLIRAGTPWEDGDGNTPPVARQLSRTGAALGAATTVALLLWATPNLGDVILLSAIPGTLAVLTSLATLLTTRAQRNITPAITDNPSSFVLRPSSTNHRPPQPTARLWMFACIAGVFALGNISVGFFLLRIASFDVDLYVAALTFATHRAATSLLARPATTLRTRWGSVPTYITVCGGVFVLLAVATLMVDAWQIWVLLLLHAGLCALTAGVGRELAVELVAREQAGEAARLHDLASGIMALPGNAIAGWFWVVGGPAGAFTYAAWAVALSLALIAAWIPWLRRGYEGYKPFSQ